MGELDIEQAGKYITFGDNRFHSKQNNKIPIKLETKYDYLELEIGIYIIK